MTDDYDLEELAALIEATGTAESIDRPIATAGREEVARAIAAQAERLAADCARRPHRAEIRCARGCTLVRIYDFPRLGPVVVKAPMTRGRDHARAEGADSVKTSLIAAPVEALIAAAGGQPLAVLLACAEHLEADVFPDALRWLATRRGVFTLDPDALPHNGIDVRAWSRWPHLGKVVRTTCSIRTSS